MSRDREMVIRVELSDEQKAAIAAFFDDLSPAQMAAIVAHWSDEQQADLFVELGKRSLDWNVPGWEHQWYGVGRHLRTCACTTADAQLIVRSIYDGLTAPLMEYEREKMVERGLDPDECGWQ